MSDTRTVSGGSGCLTTIAAAVVSYALNHSFWWAVLHFFCGPFYLLYVVFARTKEIVPALRGFFL